MLTVPITAIFNLVKSLLWDTNQVISTVDIWCTISDPVLIYNVVEDWLLATDCDCIAVGLSLRVHLCYKIWLSHNCCVYLNCSLFYSKLLPCETILCSNKCVFFFLITPFVHHRTWHCWTWHVKVLGTSLYIVGLLLVDNEMPLFCVLMFAGIFLLGTIGMREFMFSTIVYHVRPNFRGAQFSRVKSFEYTVF